MKTTLRLLGSTLSQVVDQVERLGGPVVPRSAKVLLAGLALATAAGVQANDYTDAGNPHPAPAVTQRLDEAPAAPAGDDLGTRISNSRNGIARVGGGIVGAVIGNKLSGNARTLWRAMSTLGGAYVGQAVGNAVVPDPKRRTDAARPSQPVRNVSGRHGVDARHYDLAVAASFATSGRSAHSLPSDIHSQLGSMMVDTAASRIIAVGALKVRDVRELESTASPHNQRAASAFKVADRNYQRVFAAYATHHHDAWNVIRMAQQKGFDVSAQRTVMAAVPADLRTEPSYRLDWPGVQRRVSSMRSEADRLATYSDIDGRSEQHRPVVLMRQSHR